MLTVAAILPQAWEFRLVDRIYGLKPKQTGLGQICNHFGMIVQKLDMLHLIREAKNSGKRAVGGPYVTSVPESAQEAGKLSG